jgi:PRC-barrel domain
LIHLFQTFSKGGPITVTEARETGSLIGSDKVEGTAVYGANDAKIGSIERVIIDKKSGRVSYAVLGFGGFLGIGDDHYPLPWQSLKYDKRLSHRHYRDAAEGSAEIRQR